MLSECNQLLYPQLNSMRLTNNGNLAMLARNSLSHFALASGWVLKSFLHGEQRKGISAPSILSRMLKYLNINSFVLVITSSYIWHSAFPFSLLVLFSVKCHKHALSLSFFLSPHSSTSFFWDRVYVLPDTYYTDLFFPSPSSPESAWNWSNFYTTDTQDRLMKKVQRWETHVYI